MDWTAYTYLVPVAVAGLFLAIIGARLMPALATSQQTARRTVPEVVLLVMVVAVGLAAIYGNYYLGRAYFGYWDVGSDTLEQYVPYYLNLIESLRSGTLGFWNYQYGLGTSFMSYQSWTLDPFMLVVVPLCLWRGVSWLGRALVIAQSLKILLSALLFDHLLVRFCKTPIARVFGASLYAFCGYLLLWGQHYWIGGVCVVSVALQVALEALLDRWSRPRFVAVMATSALSIVMSTYSGFMIMLFAASYALVRVVATGERKGAGELLATWWRLAVPAICGVLVSCVTLVPYAMLLLGDSSRIAGGEQASLAARALHYLRSFVPTSWIMPTLSRLLANGLISSGEPIPPEVIPPSETLSTINVFEFVSLGVSCGALLFLLQFAHWTVTEAKPRQKAVIGVGTLFVVMYLFNAFLPALNNVFSEAKYRSAFVVDILLCLASAVAFERRFVEEAPSRPLVWIGVACSLAVVGWSLVNTVNGRLECLMFLAALVMLAVLMELRAKGEARPVVTALVCLVILGSQMADGFFTTNRRAYSTAEDFPLATEPNKASDTARALSFLRAHDRGFYRVEKLDYYDWTTLDDCLVQGYAGVASYNSTLDSDVEEFYAKLWPTIYGGDTAYQEFRRDTEQRELLGMLGVRYLLSYAEQNRPWLEEVATFGHIHVYRQTGEVSVLTLYGASVTEAEADQLATAQERAGLVRTSVIVPDDTAAVTGGDVSVVDDVRLEGRSLVAKAAADNECIACLAVPNTAGWHVYVDGAEVDTFRADYGFIGFRLPAGAHQIRASFVPNGLLAGCAACACGLLLAVLACNLTGRRGDSKKA